MSEPREDDVSTWEYMPWHPEYVMQNKRLTKEHHKLVFLTNHIQHLLDTDREEVSKEVFVDELVPLAKRHLKFEILVMNTIDFKSINQELYERHCEAHADLLQGIEDIHSRIADAEMSEVIEFLKDWLDNHIRKEDAAYNSEIVKLGIKD